MVLALDDRSIEFNGIFDCIHQAVGEHGWAGVYRGFGLAFTGASLLKNVFVALTKVLVEEKMMSASSAPMWALAMGNVAAFVAYPLDTARRRMVADCAGEAYKNDIDCLFTIIRTEGITALWAGSFTNIARNIAFSVCRNMAIRLTQAIYERSKGNALARKKTSADRGAEKRRSQIIRELDLMLHAAQTGDLDFVRAFVDRADYDDMCAISAAPTAEVPLDALHAAVIGQQHEVVSFLLSRGADVHRPTLTGKRSTPQK
jgi:hypothetical protein